MSNTKQYQEFKVTIVYNKKLKHSYLRVKHDKSLEVKTPILTQGYIEAFIEEKRPWIYKQYQKLESAVYADKPMCSLEDIVKRVEYFSEVMKLEYKELKFRKMRSRWGSCSSKKIITLNKELTKVDSELIDYVVVHELAHLQYMNHSKAFHALVKSYLFDAAQRRTRLKAVRICP